MALPVRKTEVGHSLLLPSSSSAIPAAFLKLSQHTIPQTFSNSPSHTHACLQRDGGVCLCSIISPGSRFSFPSFGSLLHSSSLPKVRALPSPQGARHGADLPSLAGW